MSERITPVDLTDEWNQTKDDRDEKQFVDGEHQERDWAVTFQKRGGSWGYTVSKPGVKPKADSALSVKVGESFLDALADAEGVVAREQAQ